MIILDFYVKVYLL